MKILCSTLALLVFFFHKSLGAAGEIDSSKGCKNNPKVVGACYWINGRINAKNGWPQMIIWPIGTKRLLGVLPSEQEIVPNDVGQAFAEVMEEKYIFGKFEVCPFTKQTDGAMQFVCIESSKSLRTEYKSRSTN
jgi:hypothetical protein